MMVEAGANEVTEEEVIAAIEFAQKAMQPAIKLCKKNWSKKLVLPSKNTSLIKPDETIQDAVDAWVDGKLGAKIRSAIPRAQ